MSDLNFSILPGTCGICNSNRIKLNPYRLDKIEEPNGLAYYFSLPVTGVCEACGGPYHARGIRVSEHELPKKEVQVEVKNEPEVIDKKEAKVVPIKKAKAKVKKRD